MFRSTPSKTLLVALLVLGTTVTLAQDGTPDAADRLLDAELKELTSGDLEGALEVYRSLEKAADTPEDIRARALLYQARIHRKRGELQQARQLLEKLVKIDDTERQVLRQAQSFLRELKSGSSASPEFDWLGEMQNNPEIQARIFDLAMDLVEPGSEAGIRGGSQLLALGTMAAPMVEKIYQNSRDDRHRAHLAMALVLFGKLEYIDRALPARSDSVLPWRFSKLLNQLPDLSDGEKALLLERTAGITADNMAGRLAAVLRIHLEDDSRLEQDLMQVSRYWYSRGVKAGERSVASFQLLDQADLVDLCRRPAGATAVRACILAGLDSATLERYVSALFEVAPEQFDTELCRALVELEGKKYLRPKPLALVCRRPAGAAAVRTLLLSFPLRGYFTTLFKEAPEQFDAELSRHALEAGVDVGAELIDRWILNNDADGFAAAVAGSPAAWKRAQQHLRKRFRSDERVNISYGGNRTNQHNALRGAPPWLGRVALAAEDFLFLRDLALTDDAAVPYLVQLLQQPEQPKPVKPDENCSFLTVVPAQPSTALVAAARELLSADDPYVVLFAVSVLNRADSPTPGLLEAALRGLTIVPPKQNSSFTRSSRARRGGRRITRQSQRSQPGVQLRYQHGHAYFSQAVSPFLLKNHQEEWKTALKPLYAFILDPKQPAETRNTLSKEIVKTISERTISGKNRSKLYRVSEEDLLALLRSLPENGQGLPEEERAFIYRWLWQIWGALENCGFVGSAASFLERHIAFADADMSKVGSFPQCFELILADPDIVLPVVRKAILDADTLPWVRRSLFDSVVNAKAMDNLSWVELEELLGSRHPFAEFLPKYLRQHFDLKKLSEEERHPILAAALSSPFVEVRKWALWYAEWAADPTAVYLRGLKDAEIRVHTIGILYRKTETRFLPLLLTALELSGIDKATRILTLKAVGNLGSEDAIPALTPFLQHGDTHVRNAALEALRNIRGRLEESKEWAKILGELKERKKGKSMDAPEERR